MLALHRYLRMVYQGNLLSETLSVYQLSVQKRLHFGFLEPQFSHTQHCDNLHL